MFDTGSYECRVGWATNDDPLITFRNLIAKPRKEKAKKDGESPLIQPTQIGNDIVNIEAMRYQLRTQVRFPSFKFHQQNLNHLFPSKSSIEMWSLIFTIKSKSSMIFSSICPLTPRAVSIIQLCSLNA